MTELTNGLRPLIGGVGDVMRIRRETGCSLAEAVNISQRSRPDLWEERPPDPAGKASSTRGDAAMSGFIDPHNHDRERLDRLEMLISEVLPQLTLEALSPEARRLVEDLLSEDAPRRQRARSRFHALDVKDLSTTEPGGPQ